MTVTEAQMSLLLEKMLSSDVQVHAPTDLVEVEAKLTTEQVQEVFTDHVACVSEFLFRQQPGQFALKFMVAAYRDGFRAFQGTPLENHLKWLFRLIVHYGHEDKPRAARYLTEVAEAFMDCQAVQARVVERVGFHIQGVTTDFRGLVTALLGEYKTMALKMLAVERISQRKVYDSDAAPTHYENRLTEDIGEHLGLNADDIRRAALDVHARSRFPRLPASEVTAVVARCRELFDWQAFLQALVAELNSFNASCPAASLPRLFLDWASEHMDGKHVVFDEETCMSVQVDCTLIAAVLEILYLGSLEGLSGETCKGMALSSIFHSTFGETSQEDVKLAIDGDVTLPLNETDNLDAPVPQASDVLRTFAFPGVASGFLEVLDCCVQNIHKIVTFGLIDGLFKRTALAGQGRANTMRKCIGAV